MSVDRLFKFLIIASSLLITGTAWAGVVTVQSTAGPWDPLNTSNPDYGSHDQTTATSVNVNAGDHITITYVDGLTAAFSGVGIVPLADATGYVGSDFGSGGDAASGLTGIGSTGTFFPSHFIDPTNAGPPIYLNALIGDFVDASGDVLNIFATGNGPFHVDAPAGTVALQLGLNDDLFSDNSGALRVQVDGSTAVSSVPETSTWAMMLLGFASVGFIGFRRKNRMALSAAR
jgi:hypothetical protein